VSRLSQPFMNHICSLSQNLREDQDAIQTYCKYLPVTVNGVVTPALVDSGNNWRCAISKQYADRLGLKPDDITPVDSGRISTAKGGSYLEVLGCPKKPLSLRTTVSDTAWSFLPVIIEGFAMDINLSGPWMKKHQWDHIISRDCLRIQGKDVPLCRPDSGEEAPGSLCYVSKETTAKANSFTYVPCHAPEVAAGRMPSGDAYLRGEEHFMGATSLHPGVNSIVCANSGGQFGAVVLNTFPKDIVIKKGQRYGTLVKTCNSIQQLKKFPWRICTLEGPKSKKKKKEEYIAEFLKKSKQKKEEDKSTPLLNPNKLPISKRRLWLQKEFGLLENRLLRSSSKLDKATNVLMEFWDLFSHDGSYGKTHLLEHRLITEDVPPIKCQYRPINPALEPALKEQLDTWLGHDVIEESNSPWSSNMVAAKKAGGKIRWCVDWRRLNDITKKDSFPMPSVNDNMARLAGSTIFSAVDMAGAFHCVDLAEEDREKTAFSTPFGSFQQKRLGFGLTNGPATYCRLVDMVLKNIPTTVAIGFLDDGVIHAKNLEDHIDNLRVTLTAYAKAGLRLNPKKCNFFREEITYLGHILSAEGIRPMDSYISAVQQWKCPAFKTEARSFLGFTGYYRLHIPNYAAIAASWTSVMGKTDKPAERTPLVVTEQMKKDFVKLKKALTTAPVLGFPYFKGQKAGYFVLDTDFSQRQISGVLSQMQNGKEVPIAYGSKKLSTSQQNYPSTKGELYAGMYWMTKYSYYLQYGAEFLWRTDNSALKSVKTMQCPSSIVERWLGTLADFNFRVEHRPGVKHTNADGLSRSASADLIEETEVAEICAIRRQAFQPRHLLPWTRDELQQHQKEDPDLLVARGWVQNDKPPDSSEIKGLSNLGKMYSQHFVRLVIDKSGILRLKVLDHPHNQEKQVACLPKRLWTDTIKLGHTLGAHMATEQTLKRLQATVFFPGMKTEIDYFITNCLPCQQKRGKPKDQRHTLHSAPSGYPFQQLSIDFVGPFPAGEKTGSCWLLTVKDTFSKWMEAIPLVTATAENTVQALEQQVFSRFGFPEHIHSDMGAQFESNLFIEVSYLLGIKISNTTGYNPKGNGQVERAHRELGRMLRALMAETGQNWEILLPQVMFSMRTAVHASTGLAPFHILFGRDVSQPLDTIFGNPNPSPYTTKASHMEYCQDLRIRIDTAAQYARRNLAQAVVRQRRHYHKDKKSFLPGIRVWLYTPSLRKGEIRKLTSPWTGPWIVCAEPINDCMVRIKPPSHWINQESKVVSVDRLQLYLSTTNREPDWENDDLEMSGDEFAERVANIPNRTAPVGPVAFPPGGGGGGGGGNGGPPPGAGLGGGLQPPPPAPGPDPPIPVGIPQGPQQGPVGPGGPAPQAPQVEVPMDQQPARPLPAQGAAIGPPAPLAILPPPVQRALPAPPPIPQLQGPAAQPPLMAPPVQPALTGPQPVLPLMGPPMIPLPPAPRPRLPLPAPEADQRMVVLPPRDTEHTRRPERGHLAPRHRNDVLGLRGWQQLNNRLLDHQERRELQRDRQLERLRWDGPLPPPPEPQQQLQYEDGGQPTVLMPPSSDSGSSTMVEKAQLVTTPPVTSPGSQADNTTKQRRHRKRQPSPVVPRNRQKQKWYQSSEDSSSAVPRKRRGQTERKTEGAKPQDLRDRLGKLKRIRAKKWTPATSTDDTTEVETGNGRTREPREGMGGRFGGARPGPSRPRPSTGRPDRRRKLPEKYKDFLPFDSDSSSPRIQGEDSDDSDFVAAMIHTARLHNNT
jgi:transposase InsO family protein